VGVTVSRTVQSVQWSCGSHKFNVTSLYRRDSHHFCDRTVYRSSCGVVVKHCAIDLAIDGSCSCCCTYHSCNRSVGCLVVVLVALCRLWYSRPSSGRLVSVCSLIACTSSAIDALTWQSIYYLKSLVCLFLVMLLVGYRRSLAVGLSKETCWSSP
jgi:hypothetical protein